MEGAGVWEEQWGDVVGRAQHIVSWDESLVDAAGNGMESEQDDWSDDDAWSTGTRTLGGISLDGWVGLGTEQ